MKIISKHYIETENGCTFDIGQDISFTYNDKRIICNIKAIAPPEMDEDNVGYIIGSRIEVNKKSKTGIKAYRFDQMSDICNVYYD